LRNFYYEIKGLQANMFTEGKKVLIGIEKLNKIRTMYF